MQWSEKPSKQTALTCPKPATKIVLILEIHRGSTFQCESNVNYFVMYMPWTFPHLDGSIGVCASHFFNTTEAVGLL